jgi:hypothetical protein
LDRALFIHGQDERLLRRIDVETDDIPESLLG